MSSVSAQMHICVNGEPACLDGLEASDELSLAGVLDALGYGGKEVAVAVNETFVPRDGWQMRRIEAGDRLDIVAPIQGG